MFDNFALWSVLVLKGMSKMSDPCVLANEEHSDGADDEERVVIGPSYYQLRPFYDTELHASCFPSLDGIAMRVMCASASAHQDDDDVVFVGEYKADGAAEPRRRKTRDGLRRNPSRKARNASSGRFGKEHLTENEFAFLDESDDEPVVLKKTRVASATTRHTALKRWPVDAYDRPEYDPKTRTVDGVDSAMRNAARAFLGVGRHARAAPKKPRRKYVARGRPKKVEVARVPAGELLEVVRNTFRAVVEFCTTQACDAASSTLLRNQTTLLAIVEDSTG
ncbi:uncharacterized protein LOC132696871 [Cylas formicarius]|uniref:uncharacterized protein LOC132696871 n=1 Tax=Cylas formicarius TaxID=197179 RepID=UPI002958DC12|nr:uncharacterized protein LOC132696871 [Cylas formicarius]